MITDQTGGPEAPETADEAGPFEATPDHEALASEVARFTREALAAHELADGFRPEAWQAMAGLGLMGLPIAREYGGSGADLRAFVLAAEAFARNGGSLSMALSWGASTVLCGIPLQALGTPEQKQRWLPGIASGELIGGFALTEPGAGSDAASITTRAVRDGDDWVLDGTKMFITNGPVGHLFVVLAVTDPGRGKDGISAFLVEKGTPGFRPGAPLVKMGHWASPTSELIFEACRVPAGNLLGEVNRGYLQVALATLEWERTCLLGPGSGICQRLLAGSVAHARERRQFGRPIASFGAVRQHLGDMVMRTRTAGLLLRRVAWLKDRGQRAVFEASVAKLIVSEDCLSVADSAVQLLGGYGYIRESAAEQAYRDVKLYTLGGGTSEIQKRILADAILQQSSKGAQPARTLLSGPLVAALVGEQARDGLLALRRYCAIAPGLADSVQEAPAAVRERLDEVSRAGFAGQADAFQRRSTLARGLLLEELAAADPWLAGAAVSCIPEPGREVPSVAFVLRHDRPPLERPLQLEADGAGGYRLTGRVSRVLNADWCDLFLVAVEAGEGGPSLVSIDAGEPGLTLEAAGGWPGADGLRFANLELESVPAKVLGSGPDSRGLRDMFLAQLRCRLASVACGIAVAALEAGVEMILAADGGQELAQRQELVFPLASALAELEAARMLTWRASQELDRDGGDARELAAAALLRAIEVACVASDGALVLAGALGSGGLSRRLERATAVARSIGIAGGLPAELREVLASRALGES